MEARRGSHTSGRSAPDHGGSNSTSPTTSWSRVTIELRLYQRWPDLPGDAAIEAYTLDEVGAEKLRCIAERVQCRDLYDLHEMLEGQQLDAMAAWHLYLRKAANDVTRGRQRTPPRGWASAFDRHLAAYSDRWDQELGDYLSIVPGFGDVERRSRRHLGPVFAAAQTLSDR